MKVSVSVSHLHTALDILPLDGDTAITSGALISRTRSTSTLTSFAAVAVNAITFTDSPIKLRNSPIRKRTFLKVSSLH